ncbi:MAG: NADPH:quinone reductase [Chloroflexi bacterium]|nr:NADPH:quinone reductase [Chloroflexota bacterium]
MRAAFVAELGAADAIRYGELPLPTPGASEVLVRVEAVTVDPVDTMIRAGRYSTPVPMPFIIGRDLAGTVVEPGSAQLGFVAGERVWCNSLGHDGRQGSFAEYASVPVERLYRLPDGVDPEVAVAVAHPAATACLAWFIHARLRADEIVYVGGAGGNVGMAALQMAAEAGARVIASARQADHPRCLAAGAYAAVDYRDPSLAEHLVELAPDGIDVLWDTSGHHDLAVHPSILAVGARILVTASVSADVELPLRQLYTRDISIVGFVLSRASVTQLAEAAKHINRLLADGRLTARITERLPLSAAAEVHRRMEAGEVDGRIILRPDVIN